MYEGSPFLLGVLAAVGPSAWAVGRWLYPQRALAGALPWVSGPSPFPMLPLTEALPGVGRILSTCWPVADLRSDPALPATAPCLRASVPSPPGEHLGLLGSAGHCWAPLQLQQFLCSLLLLVPSQTCLGWVGQIPLRALSPPALPHCSATVWPLSGGSSRAVGWGWPGCVLWALWGSGPRQGCYVGLMPWEDCPKGGLEQGLGGPSEK